MNEVLKMNRVEWSRGAQERLTPACDEYFSIEELKNAVLNDEMMLFGVIDKSGYEICNFVLRLDGDEGCTEMVVVCGGGKLKGGSLFKACTPYIEEIAKRCHAQYIRGHVNSEAKAKLMERAGYLRSEIVFRKAVDYGRQIQ